MLNNWYPRYNINVKYIDLTNADNLIGALTDKTKVVYFESPANPNLDIIDIKKIVKIISDFNSSRDEEHQVLSILDNTFSTPFCQRPIEFGVDFVVHSLTKGIGGFGTDMGGAVIGKKKYKDILLLYRKDFGAVLSPKSAWAILTYGLPTLSLRTRNQIESAKKIANYLNVHPAIEFVNYPGLSNYKYYEVAKKQMVDFNGEFSPGTLIYFVLKGKNPAASKENGSKFMDYIADKAYTMNLAVSLGHTRTLIEHPASMTHSVVPPEKLNERGIDAGGVRLAIGLENVDDIIKDLDEALKIIL